MNFSTKKRSAIITPLKNVDIRTEAKCQICSSDGSDRWAITICAYCDKFICNEHSKIISNKPYCINCRNHPSSSNILLAAEFVEISNKKKRFKWCCVY